MHENFQDRRIVLKTLTSDMPRIPTEDPYMIGCMGGYTWGDEDKFNHLHNFSGGIGDRTWWVESEVLKLNSADRRLLHFMLKRNTWVRGHILTMDVVNYVSKLIKHQIDTMWCINGLNELAKRNSENVNVS
jgi:hypothetical protein